MDEQLKTTHTGQLRLTIPVFDGVSFPVSLSVAHGSELIKEKTVRVTEPVGLTKGFRVHRSKARLSTAGEATRNQISRQG